MSHRILITDRFDGEALSWLKSHSQLVISKSANPTPTKSEIQEVHALITRSRTEITNELLALAPQLRIVVTATSGFDHVDIEACKLRGVRVFHCPEGHAQSAAELTWGLVLACARKIVKASDQVHRCDWDRAPLLGTELGGKTYGVVGFGRIGKRVAKIAQSLDMKVLAYDPYVDSSVFQERGVQFVGYQELLQVSDVVSFHVPKTAETFHMLERNALECLSNQTILVNTSRGEVILEQHLIESLYHGVPGAVGLDVFEKEPLEPESPLLRLPNVILSPHIGANTLEGFVRVSRQAAETVVAFFEGRQYGFELPPQELWYTNPKGFN